MTKFGGKVYLHVADVTLASSLARWLRGRIGANPLLPHPTAIAGLSGPALLLATERDCDERLCARLVASAVTVVVLASVPSDQQRRAYEAAGASAYVPMSADTSHLEATIRALVATQDA